MMQKITLFLRRSEEWISAAKGRPGKGSQFAPDFCYVAKFDGDHSQPMAANLLFDLVPVLYRLKTGLFLVMKRVNAVTYSGYSGE